MMSNRLLFVVGMALVLAAACSGSSSDENSTIDERPTLDIVNGEISVPQSAITELTRGYRFTTDLDLSTTEEELTVHFEGESQAPDKIQGTMQVSAAPYSELGDFGLTVVGDQMWWKIDDEWQPVEQDGDTVHPLMLFNYYATPRFYLEALRFDLLALPVGGPAEMANGVESFAVQLDRQTIVQVMDQGTEFKRYPDAREAYLPGAQGIRRNLNEFLPENFAVEVWFAKNGGAPTRIVVGYDITEEDPTHLSFGLGDRLSIRLQMDITDVDPDIDIQPPLPIPTEVPTPATPPGELTDEEQFRISEIASSDPRVQEMRGGGMAATQIAAESWHTSNLDVLGGYTYVNFSEPRSYEGSLPSIVYDESETTRPPFAEIETHVQFDGIERLRVLVYLREERVVQIEVVDADDD